MDDIKLYIKSEQDIDSLIPPGSTAMTLECYSVSTTVAKCERTVSTDEVSLPDGNIADIKDSYI